MKRTVMTAALLAAFVMPAFAGDVIKNDDSAKMTKIDPVTTSSTQSDIEKTAAKDSYSGCMHRQTKLNMM